MICSAGAQVRIDFPNNDHLFQGRHFYAETSAYLAVICKMVRHEQPSERPVSRVSTGDVTSNNRVTGTPDSASRLRMSASQLTIFAERRIRTNRSASYLYARVAFGTFLGPKVTARIRGSHHNRDSARSNCSSF